MELWRYADDERRGRPYPLEKRLHDITRADPLTVQLEHFCRVVRGEQAPSVGPVDGPRSLAVALAVLESIERRAPVTPSQV